MDTGCKYKVGASPKEGEDTVRTIKEKMVVSDRKTQTWFKCRTLTLASLSPIRQTARNEGTQRLNSFIQLCRVDFGTRTICGPGMFR